MGSQSGGGTAPPAGTERCGEWLVESGTVFFSTEDWSGEEDMEGCSQGKEKEVEEGRKMDSNKKKKEFVSEGVE